MACFPAFGACEAPKRFSGDRAEEHEQDAVDQACIAFINGPMPMMFITRVRL